MRIIIAFLIIAMISGAANGGSLWVNNITVNEYNMTWSYNETFTGVDSIAFRINVDSNLGDNDSFVNAWEVLKADKELRKEFRSSLDQELDVRINNETYGVYLEDVDASLSQDLIGKTHLLDTITNRYITTYRFNSSILNARSIWFMGQADSPVTIVMPQGLDVVNISGMDNSTISLADHVEISGFFKSISKERGEISLTLSKNTSFTNTVVNTTNVTLPPVEEEKTKSMFEKLSWIRTAGTAAVGLVIILLIYIFKIRKK